MMENASTPAFRFNFAAPATPAAATEQEPQQNQSRDDNGEESETLLPPPTEVFPSEVEAATHQVEAATLFPTDPVAFQDGFVLLKGRVSTSKVLGVGKSDLVPGKYEGGLKLWECTIDLVNSMMNEMKRGQLSFQGKRVLELGCGHGLPGIFAVLKGATEVHFQDFNTEVLRSLTIPNVEANMEHARQGTDRDDGVLAASDSLSGSVHYYAGDWGYVHELLSVAAHENHPSPHAYDVILMAETVYSLPSLPKLYRLIKKCLRRPDGVLYVAGKKHYFGVGGGTRQFKALVDEDGVLEGHLVIDFVDGSSNVREIWKFLYK